MFTGIIEEQGTVTELVPGSDGSARLVVQAPLAVSDAGHGDSISIGGVCLTVVDQGPDWFAADVMGQTLAVSSLGSLAVGDRVNVERAMQAGARLGGHIVQGHVDGSAALLSRSDQGSWHVLRFSLPRDLAPLVVDKGSIAVAGVSLTVSAVSAPTEPEQWFEVSLIPETLAATTLGALEVGGAVNLETDVLARHVQRLAAFGGGPLAAAPENHSAAATPATAEGGAR
ncbi:riboflavin synthase [Herbiconiux sp. L3-i23]|uniref:riboflavin synthase n=1 Tax=Herbiconiux sp. L3-i23 TaxID=2905871 RepID=UPI00206ED2F8|nr:riboflavin synthase [Herbiconiux sp. L3-i23]BDI21558.1 riboflavin synthase subunit alpha [Herbiconiux sp. L3-i23]